MSHDHLKGYIDAILDSYSTLGGINHSDQFQLPTRHSIRQLILQIREVLFPGYFDETPLNSENLPFVIGQKIVTIRQGLSREVEKSLRWQAKESEQSQDGLSEKAQQMVCGFLASIPEMRRILKEDVEATYQGDPAARSDSEIILSYPGLQATMVYRTAHYFYNQDVAIIPRMMTEIAHGETGIDIHPGAKIGPGFCIDHGTGIVIGETAEIGQNVKIYQGVTLGALSVPKEKSSTKRHPTIGDNVVIYAETTILGGDTFIGKNSVIGGNVWLTNSVPENAKIYLSHDYKHLIKEGKRS
jgi:serine O-acetyltransferase